MGGIDQTGTFSFRGNTYMRFCSRLRSMVYYWTRKKTSLHESLSTTWPVFIFKSKFWFESIGFYIGAITERFVVNMKTSISPCPLMILEINLKLLHCHSLRKEKSNASRLLMVLCGTAAIHCKIRCVKFVYYMKPHKLGLCGSYSAQLYTTFYTAFTQRICSVRSLDF